MWSLLFRRQCLRCGVVLDRDMSLCPICYEEMILGSRAESNRILLYQRLRQRELQVSGVEVVFGYRSSGSLHDIIHQVKYRYSKPTAYRLGGLLAEQIIDRDWGLDLICPVPLHPIRMLKRSFNQSYEICRAVSEKMGVPVQKIVDRTRSTKTQTRMSATERERNLQGAFECKNSLSVSGKNILVIDDIVTTGSTLHELCHTIYQSGAKAIYIGALAVSVG